MIPKTRVYLHYCLLAVLFSLLFSCATVPYTGRQQLVLMDRGQELALGQQAAQQIMKEENITNDPRYVRPVREVGRRIAVAANRPDFRWSFNVIDNPSEPNAFALPGGKVFIYTGMFKYIQNDAELATVLAHETAHAIARHGAERMSEVMLAQLGGAVAAQALNVYSPGSVQAFSTAYGLATNLGVILPHSRAQESEADRIGLILMAQAGYDPRAALSFWTKMMRSNRGRQGPAFLSTHPTDQQRLANIQALIPEAMRYYTGGTSQRSYGQ